MKGKNRTFIITVLVLLIFLAMLIGTLLVIKYIKVNDESFGTEAAVGAGVTSLLFFVTLKKIRAMEEDVKNE